MTNTALIPTKVDARTILDTVLNGPHGNTVILSCTICALAGIAGICFLASKGQCISLSTGNTKFQVTADMEKVF